jgi:hypothetical protein
MNQVPEKLYLGQDLKQHVMKEQVVFIVLANWNNGPQIDMSLHSDTLSYFRANQSLLFLLNSVCLVEKQHIPIL